MNQSGISENKSKKGDNNIQNLQFPDIHSEHSAKSGIS